MSTLVDDLRGYLMRTHAYAWTQSASPDEPALVHAFLADEMWPVLQDILRARVKSNTDIIVRGIFTHQTPQVKEVGATKGCEIADLMLVRMHMPKELNEKPYGKSVLLQAKHKDGPRTESLQNDGDAAQLKLYREWNKFLATTARIADKPAGSDAWNFQGADLEKIWRETAQYLTVLKGHIFSLDDPMDPGRCSVSQGPGHSIIEDQGWPNGTPWANGGIQKNAKPEEGIECPNDFAFTLSDFVFSKVGRSFDTECSANSDHWSLFVGEMLRIAGLPEYKFGKKKLSRTNSAAVSTFSSLLPLIGEQQLRDFLNGTLQNDFAFINAGIQHEVRSVPLGTGGGATTPDNTSHSYFSNHIPILLVLTYGEELVIE